MEQGREEVDDDFYFGEVLQRGKSYGWIKPSNFGKLPSEVQTKVKEMVKVKRAAVKEHNSENSVFKQNVLFVHMSDVEAGVKVARLTSWSSNHSIASSLDGVHACHCQSCE